MMTPEQTRALAAGYAVIKIDGSLSRTRGAGPTVSEIEANLLTPLRDKQIKTIVLEIHSSGGIINGISALANFIFQAREVKKIISITDADMLSAAYSIGAAAHKIYLGSPQASVGSIGCVCRRYQARSPILNKGERKMSTTTVKELWELLPQAPGICEECRQTNLKIIPHGAIVYCIHNKASGMIFMSADKASVWTIMVPVSKEFHNQTTAMIMGIAVSANKQVGP